MSETTSLDIASLIYRVVKTTSRPTPNTDPNAPPFTPNMIYFVLSSDETYFTIYFSTKTGDRILPIRLNSDSDDTLSNILMSSAIANPVWSTP